MAKFKVKVRPSGLINGQEWPDVDEVVELDDAVGDGMADAGWLERVKKVEKRPAAKKGEETR